MNASDAARSFAAHYRGLLQRAASSTADARELADADATLSALGLVPEQFRAEGLEGQVSELQRGLDSTPRAQGWVDAASTPQELIALGNVAASREHSLRWAPGDGSWRPDRPQVHPELGLHLPAFGAGFVSDARSLTELSAADFRAALAQRGFAPVARMPGSWSKSAEAIDGARLEQEVSVGSGARVELRTWWMSAGMARNASETFDGLCDQFTVDGSGRVIHPECKRLLPMAERLRQQLIDVPAAPVEPEAALLPRLKQLIELDFDEVRLMLVASERPDAAPELARQRPALRVALAVLASDVPDAWWGRDGTLDVERALKLSA